MEAVESNLYRSLKKYYTHLSNVGYPNKEDLKRLLVYLFIEDIFEYALVPTISDEDLAIINKALHNLYDSSCVIPHPDVEYINETPLSTIGTIFAYPRITLNNELRNDGVDTLRLTEDNTF